MKRISLLILFPIVWMLSCQSDREKFSVDTTVEVDNVYDFGEVMQGEKVKARFEIKNTGDVDLKIFEVKPSCGCTLADYTEEPIAPGKMGWIEAEVDTKDIVGTTTKTVTLMANTQPTAIPLTIKGKVLSKEF